MGLIKTAGKVAVASAVHGRIQRRQQQRWAAQDLAAAPVPAQPTMDDRLDQITKLGNLLQAGLLTEAEFQQQKEKILNA